MKKSIIALAVAGALTAPMIAQADATLYGTAQWRGVKTDTDSFNSKVAKTRLGVKGTVDNDIEGLTTGFQFEWEFNANKTPYGSTSKDSVTLRKSSVYAKGAFGMVSLGRQNNPLQAVENMTDILGNDSAYGHVLPDRLGNVSAYISPKFSGAEVYVAAISDGVAETDADFGDDVDGTVVGFNWSGAGFGVSAGIQDLEGAAGADSEVTALGVSYSGVENLYVGLSYTATEVDNAAAEPETTALAASYSMGKTTLAAIYTMVDPDTGADDAEQIMVGVRYALGAKASVGVDYADYNDEAGDNDTLVLEYTLSF